MATSREDVARFLADIRDAVDGKGTGRIIFVSTDKNKALLARLGFTHEAALEDIKSLTVEDFSSGPEPDDQGRPCFIWKFGTNVDEIEIYVKFGDWRPGKPEFFLISYHERERPLPFPFRKP